MSASTDATDDNSRGRSDGLYHCAGRQNSAAIIVGPVCTLVGRWAPDDAFPVQLLALRDEHRRRAFDEPAEWWPEVPGAIGGRDRTAGGSWCVSDPANGTSAVVLNRPERRIAGCGAPSRGVLPLLALRHGPSWPQYIEIDAMASFNLVLAAPAELRWWSFDGVTLTDVSLDPGTYVFKPRGLIGPPDDLRLLENHPQLDSPGPSRS